MSVQTNQTRGGRVDLPSADEMFRAFIERDHSFDGVFFTGVRTTGIFCRPTCRARKPRRQNVEFFPTVHEALMHGYRPCRLCNPLLPSGTMPEWVRRIIDATTSNPEDRFTDDRIRALGANPVRLRRWFKTYVGMTFHDYCRSLRVGLGLAAIAGGSTATNAAFDAGYESLSGFGEAVRMVAGASPTAAATGGPILAARIASPLGSLVVGATGTHLVYLEFAADGDRDSETTRLGALGFRLGRPVVVGRNAIHDRIEVELGEYFAGCRTQFETPVDVPGTAFQMRAWSALRDIPYGQTRSYAEQAAATGNPSAVRAVARANGANRVVIVIPCHRVIGANGKLTGYGGGLWRKQRLLDLEAGRLRF